MFPVKRLKELILHPDKYVRRDVARYITEGRVCNPDIMPLVLESCEKYGYDNCLSLIYSNEHQYISPQIAEKLLCAFKNASYLAKMHLSKLIQLADIDFLESNIERILKISDFDPKQAKYRLEYKDYTAEKIWQEMENFAGEECDIEAYSKLDYPRKEAILEKITSFDNMFDEKISQRVKNIAQNTDSLIEDEWILDTLNIELAGRRQLIETIDDLNEIMKFDHYEVFYEEACRSLKKIHSDKVIDAVKTDFLSESWYYQLNAAVVLGSHKSDYSIETIVHLLKNKPEYENSIYANLCFCLCDQFTEKAFDWGLTMVDDEEAEEFDNIKERLINLTCILGVDIPSISQWKDEVKQHRQEIERRIASFNPHLIKERIEALMSKDDDADLLDIPCDYEPYTGALVNKQPKIGRNDPCPCGSNKKYKKCCGKNT